MRRLYETRRFLQSSSFWEARRALIGQLSSALWLAEYQIVMPMRNETKTIKHIINEAFVASIGDIITDYNDLLSFYASRHVYITTSAFVIEETTNNKRYSTLLKTRVWIVSSRNVLKGCESDAPDTLFRNNLCA